MCLIPIIVLLDAFNLHFYGITLLIIMLLARFSSLVGDNKFTLAMAGNIGGEEGILVAKAIVRVDLV